MTHGWNAARAKGVNGERTEGGRPGDGMENGEVGRSFHGVVSVFGGTGMKGGASDGRRAVQTEGPAGGNSV